MIQRTVHIQPRTLRRPLHLLADAIVNVIALLILRFLRKHRIRPLPGSNDHAYFAPVLPTFFFNRSPAYRTPLFLYGSGGRSDRISAATCPTCCRSIPVSEIFVCFGSTAASTPVGSGYSMGCEYPRLNTTVPLPFNSARYPMPTISRSRVHPLVTPSTALFTRARANPWTAACESLSRIATMLPSFCSTLMPLGRIVSS